MSFSIVFPGQGSQSVGMLANLASEWTQVGETFGEASDALGYDLWTLVQEGPDADLNQTDKTQPAMLAAGVAAWRVWNAAGGAAPSHVAGHSLGEYTALVAAGALDFATAIKLVEKRGQLMQAAVPEGHGAMAAILGMTDDAVIKACDEAAQGCVVQAVNFNAPGQVVIAGTTAAVGRAVALCKEAGAKRALLLSVSVPSHCSLMQPAAEKLAQAMAGIEIKKPEIPVLHNVDAAAHGDAAGIRVMLEQQLYKPVRWVETIQALSAAGVDSIVECGPGKVLAGLNKRIDRGMSALPVFDSASLQKALDTLKG